MRRIISRELAFMLGATIAATTLAAPVSAHAQSSRIDAPFDTMQFAAALDPDAYDLVFVDPPYESRQLDLVLASWRERRFARVLVAEHARVHALPAGALRLTFDDTLITVYRSEPRAGG